MRPHRRAVVLASLLLAAAPVPAGAAGPPSVVASVKPIHSLVAGVMAGIASPRLLVEGGRSPHTYALEPSQARWIETADLIVWVGPTLEPFLARPVRHIAQESADLALMRVKGLELLRTRKGGAWAEHAHDGAQGAESGDAGGGDGRHAHGGSGETGALQGVPARELDPHIWLDPDNALRLVDAIAARLAALDPGNAGAYAANAEAMRRRIDRAAAEARRIVQPVADVPYVVFHDAYHYFERHFALNAVGAITLGPARRPGARRLVEIRARITELGARCVFHEPQFAPRLLDSVVEGTGARVGRLDPLGSELAPGPEAYPDLLLALARDLADCLGGRR